jgi:fluoride exporter
VPGLLLTIFLGGGIGALARFRLARWIYARTGASFPWGTLAVNVSGSFALGLVLPLLDALGPLSLARGFLTVGCIGAFTTFSTFAYEAVMLLQEGRGLRAGLYIASSLGLGLVSIAAGLLVGSAVA